MDSHEGVVIYATSGSVGKVFAIHAALDTPRYTLTGTREAQFWNGVTRADRPTSCKKLGLSKRKQGLYHIHYRKLPAFFKIVDDLSLFRSWQGNWLGHSCISANELLHNSPRFVEDLHE